ncbi:sigma-54 dependent transcriptional regulator [Iodidimonas sp. MBR-22]|uniref:sigma-54-dependent transcriptional regulator n=1 Tax=unclassified Iodidimonas TaxID=2626145 RepID=UPI0032B2942C
MIETEALDILIVEDSPSLAQTYAAYLGRLDARTVIAGSLAEAKAALGRAMPDLILLDLNLPDGDGLSLLAELPERAPRPPVVVITAHGSVSVAVQAMRAGATDFLVKPFDAERLVITMRNALENWRLANLVKRYEESFQDRGFGDFVGKSLPMQAVYRMIKSAAPSRASVFISGESGTGKELCAMALHRHSPRRHAPYIVLNMAALPSDLIESEIFGHKKGAFTGATADREGAAVKAHGGTLFLDEICEMDLALQAKLLRFLQTGVVQPLGSDETRKVDVRIICATNRDPMREVAAGRMREDLFYRLHVIPIDLPPLRERGTDIIGLARSFLHELSREEGKSFERFTEEAETCMLGYDWPGNVRELRNVIHTAVVLYDGVVLEQPMLSRSLQESLQKAQALKEQTLKNENAGRLDDMAPMIAMDQPSSPQSGAGKAEGAVEIEPLAMTEERAIRRAIALCDGNITRAAGRLEVSPSTLYRKLQSWDNKA